MEGLICNVWRDFAKIINNQTVNVFNILGGEHYFLKQYWFVL